MNRFDVVRPHNGPIERPLTRCLDCGSDDLNVVTAAESEGVELCCASCGACWLVELGYVHRAAPREDVPG